MNGIKGSQSCNEDGVIYQAAVVEEYQAFLKQFIRAIIEARCTDKLLWSITSVIGIIVICLHTIPLITNSWVYLTEPRSFGEKNENGDLVEIVFHYNCGYFQMCRALQTNGTLQMKDIDTHIPRTEREYQCRWNPIFTGKDLTDFSTATLAIQSRLYIPALMHGFGATVCFFAFYLGIHGHLKKSPKSLVSAILYICGGLVILMGVLQFVCVVDDELAPRMKPNAAGEPSKFTFRYGYSFFFSALSFLPLQMCACFNAFLYFRRYPSAVEKMNVVPGLEAKIRRAEFDRALGLPSFDPVKRGSLCALYPPQSSRASSISVTHSLIPAPPTPKLISRVIGSDFRSELRVDGYKNRLCVVVR
ncbi:hypothetical protein AB6A40_000335 [Gnathostoma spinigerum]|uniref:Uncharacterized protein n=1 Tax=Gnathostoma spinigerum TaxID=75299 RepID=A0ABD6E354_9BILA